jgi:Cro/C1-type HTH DNA-binding domain
LDALIEQLEAESDGEKVYDSTEIGGKTYLYEMNSRPYLNNQVYALYRYHNCGSIDNQLGYAERRADGCLNAFIGDRRIGQFWELDEAFMAIIEASETPAPVETAIEAPAPVEPVVAPQEPETDALDTLIEPPAPVTVETPVELRQLDGEFVSMVKPTIETPAPATINARAEIAQQLTPYIETSHKELAKAIDINAASLSIVLNGKKMAFDTLEKLMTELNLAFRPQMFIKVWSAKNMESLDYDSVVDHYLNRPKDFEPITTFPSNHNGYRWRVVKVGKRMLVASVSERTNDFRLCVVER